jgi:hypothetical protein
MKRFLFPLLASLALAGPTQATTIIPSSLIPVAIVTTLGEYDNAGLGSWNGQPLSASNQPTAQQDQLSATWNFYVDPVATNTLYIIVGNVADTNYGWILGPPFNSVALTGFQFSLKVPTSSYASFSNQFAVQTEALLGPTSGSSTPLETTPGWAMTASGPTHHAVYQIATPTVSDAFTHFSSVWGDTRIFGGGVFQLTFDPSVDLLHVNFNTLSATATNGEGLYTEVGTVLPQSDHDDHHHHLIDDQHLFNDDHDPTAGVPEPSTWALMLLGFAGLGFAFRRSRRKAAFA